MNGLKLLMVLIPMSFTAFSQIYQPERLTLQPIVQQSGNDTLFCFTLSQAKYIARQIEEKRYCDTLTVQLNRQIELQSLFISAKDSIISSQSVMLHNAASIQTNQEQQITTLQKNIQLQEQHILKNKRQKRILSVALVVIGIVAIVN